MDHKLWIVVANSTCVRIFKCESVRNFVEIETFVHPQGRMHEGDLKSDRSGSTLESFHAGYSSLAQPQSQKKIEQDLFAKKVTKFLEQARSKGEVERIHIASSPNFLGALRGAMETQLSGLVDKTISKDITHEKPEALTKYFFVV